MGRAPPGSDSNADPGDVDTGHATSVKHTGPSDEYSRGGKHADGGTPYPDATTAADEHTGSPHEYTGASHGNPRTTDRNTGPAHGDRSSPDADADSGDQYAGHAPTVEYPGDAHGDGTKSDADAGAPHADGHDGANLHANTGPPDGYVHGCSADADPHNSGADEYAHGDVTTPDGDADRYVVTDEYANQHAGGDQHPDGNPDTGGVYGHAHGNANSGDKHTDGDAHCVDAYTDGQSNIDTDTNGDCAVGDSDSHANRHAGTITHADGNPNGDVDSHPRSIADPDANGDTRTQPDAEQHPDARAESHGGSVSHADEHASAGRTIAHRSGNRCFGGADRGVLGERRQLPSR